MRSVSSLAINWQPPEVDNEEWEFAKHPAKQPFYEKHGITWEGIVTAFGNGQLVAFPRSGEICGVPVRLAYHDYDDYCRYLAKAKRGYRINYNKMEEALQREKELTMPAAIVIKTESEALLFSGYRRLCLAWNYGMVPFVWLVDVKSELEEVGRAKH